MKNLCRFGVVALLSLLWLMPAAAQGNSKQMATKRDLRNHADQVLATVKQEKAPVAALEAFQAQNAVKVERERFALENAAELKISDLKGAAKTMPAAKIRIGDLKRAAAQAELNLTEEQKLEMVRDYMRAAMPTFQNAPKEGETTVPSKFMGGSYGESRRFTISGTTFSQPEIITSLNAGKLGYASIPVFPWWGAWCEDHFEGYCYYYNGNAFAPLGYFMYNPLLDQVTEFKRMNDTAYMAAYNPVDKKIYALDFTQISIDLYSAAPNTGTFTKKENSVTGIADDETPVAMAISQEGKMYVIALGAKNSSLYEVNISTSAATKIGNTGVVSDGDFFQSATFDARTGNLYWMYWDATDKAGIVATVSTTDGKATTVNNNFDEMNALSCVYFTAKRPAAIADFGLAYDGNTDKIKATFTLPSVDVNGDALTSLDSVEITRYANSEHTRVFAQKNPTPGQKLEAEIDATGLTGTPLFYVRTKNGDAYSIRNGSTVLCYKVTMPYANGFEESDNELTEATVSISPANATIEKVNTENHTTGGSNSYKVTSGYLAGKNQNMFKINGIPVKKGAAYTVSFWVKGSKAGQRVACLNATSGSGWIKTLSGTDWEQHDITLSTTANGQMSIGFMGDDNVYYIDDIRIEETGAPSRPAKIAINGVTAADDGSLKAKVNITLPDKDAAGENLTAITKIKLTFSNRLDRWSEAGTKFQEFTEGLTPGATKDFEITVPKAGIYWLKGLAFNNGGESPLLEYSTPDDKNYQGTPWIGYDTLPAKVTVTAAPQTDGKSKLVWSKAKGPNGGYLGTVTYTVKKGNTSLYEGTDTTCVTSSALDLGMNVLTMSFSNTQPDIRKERNKSQTVYALGGLSADMMYCNAYNGLPGYSQYILNTSATENNSALTQVMYPKTDKAIYIDNLLIFTDAPEETPTTAAKEKIKVYMGTTDKEEFDAFIEKDQLTLVYDGELSFEVGKNTHNLPLSGFYYDGTKNLVISIVKPKQDKTSFDAWAFVGSEFPTKKNYFITSLPDDETDFDALTESYNATVTEPTPDKFNMAMIAKPAAASALRALKVTVKDVDVTQAGAPDVTIEIKKDAAKAGKNLNVQLKTNANGVAEFAYMPMGNFKVTVKARGFATQTIDLEIAEATPATKELNIDFKRAAKVKFEGVVTDKANLKLSGVKIKADDGFETKETTTNAEGKFKFEEVYCMNDYTLTFEKAGMQTLTKEFSLGEKDSVIAEAYKMSYILTAVPYAAVKLNQENKAVVTWDQAAVGATATWKTPNAARKTRFTYDNYTAIKYAQRFLPADLAALKLGTSPKAVRFGFVPGSTTAKYTLVLANDTASELYRYEVPADKVVPGEWCDFEVPNKAINPAKQLWVIVEVAADENGNQNYPVTVDIAGTNPYAGKGNLMWANGKWAPLTAYNTNITGNVFIRAMLIDESTKVEPKNGYRVYRGKEEDKFEDYTLLTTESIKTGRTYTDANYKDLTFGVYNYAVVADYYETDFSKPAYTNNLNKDMEFTVQFNVTSTAGAGEARGAEIYLADTGDNREYGAMVGADGKATIAGKVWRNKYIYKIALPYHVTLIDTLYLSKDTILNVTLNEVMATPEITKATIEGKNVVTNYGVNLNNWVDDVESYEDFAIANLGPWIMNKGVAKAYLDQISWKNNSAAQSWIVMNFSKTSPALTNYGFVAASGKKCFMAWAVPDENTYHSLLVRPVSKGGGKFSFACAVFNPEVAEDFAVIYSSTTADSSAFQPVPKGEVKNFDNADWETMSFDIPADAKFIGIRYSGKDGKYGITVDDLVYITEDFAKPKNYELYVDGTKVGTSNEGNYTFQNLEFGDHTLGVKAVYGRGASEMATKTVSIVREATPIRLNAEVEESTVVLTWQTPEGFTPASFKVFLDDELKAENLTANTHTFTNLAPGDYKAEVSAVYGTGESKRVSVEFTVLPLGAPSNLSVKTNKQTTALSWTAPEGIAPQSYKVFLNNELKAEGVTETVYFFKNLPDGKYTAGVVAVFKTGESEKVSLDFTVDHTGVEEVADAVRAMVYPNPNNGLFYLQTNGAGVAEVYSLSGAPALRMVVPAEGTYEINLQNRAKGAYVLRFIGKDNSATIVKLIVR